MKLVCRYVPASAKDLPFCLLAVADEGEREELFLYVCSRVDEAFALAPLLTDQADREQFEQLLARSALSPDGPAGTTTLTSSAARMAYTLLVETFEQTHGPPRTRHLPDWRLYLTPPDDGDPSMVTLFFRHAEETCVVHFVYSLRQYAEACDDPALTVRLHDHATQLVEHFDIPEESEAQAVCVTGAFASFLVQGLLARADREQAQRAEEEMRVNVLMPRQTLMS